MSTPLIRIRAHLDRLSDKPDTYLASVALGTLRAAFADLELAQRVAGGCREKSERLEAQLASMQHVGQAGARVTQAFGDDPRWDAESPMYTAAKRALDGKR